LEKSTAYATLLTPTLGYDKVSKAVKEAVNEKKTIREVIVGKGYLAEENFDSITNLNIHRVSVPKS
jgi:aspartate ammonia-lyase